MDPKKLRLIFKLMKEFHVEHFRHADFEIKLSSYKPEISSKTEPVKKTNKRKIPPQQAIPIVEQSIPHHENEVAKLLKLSDHELVDRLFPDYTQKAGN